MQNIIIQPYSLPHGDLWHSQLQRRAQQSQHRIAAIAASYRINRSIVSQHHIAASYRSIVSQQSQRGIAEIAASYRIAAITGSIESQQSQRGIAASYRSIVSQQSQPHFAASWCVRSAGSEEDVVGKGYRAWMASVSEPPPPPNSKDITVSVTDIILSQSTIPSGSPRAADSNP